MAEITVAFMHWNWIFEPLGNTRGEKICAASSSWQAAQRGDEEACWRRRCGRTAAAVIKWRDTNASCQPLGGEPQRHVRR